jgi:hypothetical protein
MKLLLGLIVLVAAVGIWKLSLPKGGKPRSFVNTNLEAPIALVIIGALALGVVLSIGAALELVAAKSAA